MGNTQSIDFGQRLCGLTFALNGASKGAKRRLRASVFERAVSRALVSTGSVYGYADKDERDDNH